MPPRTSQKPYMKVFARPRLAAIAVIEYKKKARPAPNEPTPFLIKIKIPGMPMEFRGFFLPVRWKRGEEPVESRSKSHGKRERGESGRWRIFYRFFNNQGGKKWKNVHCGRMCITLPTGFHKISTCGKPCQSREFHRFRHFPPIPRPLLLLLPLSYYYY